MQSRDRRTCTSTAVERDAIIDPQTGGPIRQPRLTSDEPSGTHCEPPGSTAHGRPAEEIMSETTERPRPKPIDMISSSLLDDLEFDYVRVWIRGVVEEV